MRTKNTLKRTLKIVIGVALMVVSVVIAFSVIFKVSPVSWIFLGAVNANDGIAIEGYDPVAYYRDTRAIKDDPSINTR